ncbi:hypothetical protein DNX69_01140 [Rhodopseudomonas palustris]|uniref:Triple helix repeat-containing collagen n=1 Tax=Rhodopseudomonas palustris TaxID=1076 RepID=A0A323UL68_RHOPL|nr:hypothetical protein [Rhodopseudomonas palustris]PZA13852.1 hypothetical protein DNX69_01140 [Rhodopseudomonas palustris]
MKLSTLIVACIAAAVVVFGVRNFESEPSPTDTTEQAVAPAAPAPVSPIKTLTSTSCPSDGCPVSCAEDDTLLSAFCVSGTKARFADTLKLAGGKLTATCGMGASSILAYCGRP